MPRSKTVTSRFILKGDNRLNSAFSKAKRQLGALSKQAAIFGAVAVAATAAVVKKQAEQIDILAKSSDALGVTTESLQALQTMGELAGVGAEDLTKKLGKMQKNLGEIARRGGTMAEALADVGLNIKNVIELPADKQFEAIAGALAKMENQTLRVSIASDLFGRDAGKLLKLTDQLAKDGIAGMRAELEQLGFLISRSDAAGVERMNDSMAIANKAIKGVAQKFTIELAPAIAAISEAFIDSAKDSKGFRDDVTNSALTTATAIGFVADVVDSVGRTFQLTSKLGILAFEGLKVTVVGLNDAIINGPNRAVNLLLQQLNKLPGIDIDFRFADLIPGIKNDLDLSAEIVRQTVADIDAILSAPLPSQGLEERIKRIRAELAKFQQETKSGDTGGVDDGTASIKKKVEAIDQFAVQAARNIQTAFADFLFDPFDKGLDGMLKGFLNTIRRMVSEIASQQILKALFSGLASNSSSFLSGLGKAFGGGKAHGGPIDAGRAFLVGERGPELIVPRTAGTVIPNNRLGGNSVVVHIDARENVDPGRLLALVPVIQTQIERSLALKRRRGFA